MSKTAHDTITLEMVRDALYVAVVCDALDSMGLTHQSPRVQLPPMTGCAKLAGRCKTTLWEEIDFEDPNSYAKELQAVDSCRSGDVLIAAAGGSMRSGIWGELLSTAARNSGCAGAIVDGSVRDVAKMAEMGFAVFARGTCPYDSMNRQRVKAIDVSVEIDGVALHPGDLVIADTDGVVVVPQDAEAEALRRAWAKVHDENVTRDAIRAGMKATDAYAKYGVL